LMSRCLRIFRRIFGSKFEAVLTQHLVPHYDFCENVCWHMYGNFKSRPLFCDSYKLFFSTRYMYEHAIRKCVSGEDGVGITIMEQCTVMDLIAEDTNHPLGRRRVTGVNVVNKRSSSPGPVPMYADLVIDASGKDSKNQAWLQKIGVKNFSDEYFIKADVCYVSWLIECKKDEKEEFPSWPCLPARALTVRRLHTVCWPYTLIVKIISVNISCYGQLITIERSLV